MNKLLIVILIFASMLMTSCNRYISKYSFNKVDFIELSTFYAKMQIPQEVIIKIKLADSSITESYMIENLDLLSFLQEYRKLSYEESLNEFPLLIASEKYIPLKESELDKYYFKKAPIKEKKIFLNKIIRGYNNNPSICKTGFTDSEYSQVHSNCFYRKIILLRGDLSGCYYILLPKDSPLERLRDTDRKMEW